MDDPTMVATAIGVALGAFLFVALMRPSLPGSSRRALAVGCFGVGFVCAYWLRQHPWEAERLSALLTNRGVGLLLVALAGGTLFWKYRSWSTG